MVKLSPESQIPSDGLPVVRFRIFPPYQGAFQYTITLKLKGITPPRAQFQCHRPDPKALRHYDAMLAIRRHKYLSSRPTKPQDRQHIKAVRSVRPKAT